MTERGDWRSPHRVTLEDVAKHAQVSRALVSIVMGAPGSGALVAIGSHAAYLAEFLCGEIREVSGGRFATAITKRPVPLGNVTGHGKVAVSDSYEAVENDDYASFSAKFQYGVGVVQAFRVAAGHPNGLALEVFGDNGAEVGDGATR